MASGSSLLPKSAYLNNAAIHSGKVLDVNQPSTVDGANVQQWGYWGSANQQWVTQNVRDNVYTFENVNSEKLLGVKAGSMDNGANDFQWSDLGADNQRWYVEETASDQYRIEAVHSGKVLEVSGRSTEARDNSAGGSCPCNQPRSRV